MHKCPIPGCERMVLNHLLMCAVHWKQVPAAQQTELYTSWGEGGGRGTVRHQRAMEAAIKSVAGETPDPPCVIGKWYKARQNDGEGFMVIEITGPPKDSQMPAVVIECDISEDKADELVALHNKEMQPQ